MTVSKPRRRTKPQGDNRFVRYVMFSHLFGGLAGIFKDD